MRLRCSSFLHTPRRAWKGMHMRNYTTQMEAARKQIVTKELEIVAQKEHMTTEELMPLVAEGKVVIWDKLNDGKESFEQVKRDDLL